MAGAMAGPRPFRPHYVYCHSGEDQPSPLPYSALPWRRLFVKAYRLLDYTEMTARIAGWNPSAYGFTQTTKTVRD
ncbi:hypothetical protein KSF_093610 [Reticulibacter mediterranei]|uniref:Uncharacterized protein n=1 Tax=Reticulibacter mediterranei TaxID=2778369 RepID=A0A8J3IVI0_9CHLR|nr:hypothetical protein KSF_093610 [Reticulibacter mediterranei]